MERKEQRGKQKKSVRGKEEPRSSDRGKWRKRHGLMKTMRNESLKRSTRKEKSVRREVSWQQVGRGRPKTVGPKGRGEKEIEERRSTKREKWRRHVAFPFLAKQVHASILAMPGGKCLVQSRSEIATFRRTVPSFPPEIVLLLLVSSDPSLACALATHSRRIALCRRLREPLHIFPHNIFSLHENYIIHRSTFFAAPISIQKKNLWFSIAIFYLLIRHLFRVSKI